MRQRIIIWVGLMLLALGYTFESQVVHGQSLNLPSSPLKLDQAIQFAIDHYPAVRVSVARVAAAKSGIDLARTAYLPRLDMGYQVSNGTFNNVSGLFFPNAFTLPI